MMLLFPGNTSAQEWSYDFEDFASLTASSSKKKVFEVELNGLKWHMCGVTASTAGSGDFINGTGSMKMYGEQDCGWSAPEETTNFTLMDKHSIGTFSFTIAPNELWQGSEINQVDWIVQFSTDGNTWTTVGDSFRPWNGQIDVKREINHPAALVRIIRADYQTFDFTKGSGYSFIANVDDMSMTEFTGTEVPEFAASVETLDFGEVEKGTEKEMTFTLTHKNLSAPVEMSMTGDDAAAFTIKNESLSDNGSDEITIAMNAYRKGDFAATFVAKCGDLKINVNIVAVAKGAEGVKFSGGTGTMEDPYQITCKEDLFELSDDVEKNLNSYKGQYFKMMNDINMDNVSGFRPIGNNFDRTMESDENYIRPFSGTFDGGNHKVYNFNGNFDGYGFTGLFGIVEDGTIKNLTIANSNIFGDLGVGAIVGVCLSDCVISNCHTTADVKVSNRKFYVGGIVGGLLAGGANGTIIEDCTNRAQVNGIVGYSAGIVATTSQAGTKILRCGNYGEIIDNNLHVAGICSNAEGSILIEDCYNAGNLQMLTLEGSTNAVAGGILASLENTAESDEIVVRNCYNLGQFNVIGSQMHPILNEDMSPYFNTKVENCYFSTELNSMDFENIINVTLAEMQTEDFVAKLNNGREEGVAPWMIKAGKNNGYPVPELLMASKKFSGGNGSAEAPYLISNTDDLSQLASEVEAGDSFAGKYFQMTNDIDMIAVKDIHPIGNNMDGDLHPFSGIFDGAGHKVINFNADWTNIGFVGFFGIGMNATIKNFTIAKSTIYGDLSVAAILGVGMGDCVIENCHTTADVTVTDRKFYVAGICGGFLIAGENGSVIKDCTNAAKVNGCVGYTAGILATNGQPNAQIIRCGNTGVITDDNLHVAGIVAHAKNGISIVDCYNTGDINLLGLEGASNALGAGIIASADEIPAEENLYITNCYNLGKLSEESEDHSADPEYTNKMHAIYDASMAAYENVFIENCYYSNEINKNGYSNATALSLAEMQSEEFVNKLNNGRTGAEACWMIKEGANNGYPVPENIDGEDTGIDCVENTTASDFTYNAGIVTISNVAAGAQVRVFDVTGRTVMAVAADAQGNASVDMNALGAGAYIVNVNGRSIKVAR